MFFCTNKHLLFLVVLGLAIVLGLAYFFHWQIVLSYAPFLLILLCPLMHLFGGHGNHQTNQEQTHKSRTKPSCH